MNAAVQKTLLDHLHEQIPEKQPVATISFDRYLFTGQTLLNQANIYRRVGDEANLYLFLYRFASLMVFTLPKHPGFVAKDAKYVHYKKKLRDECLPEIEKLNTKLSKMPATQSTMQRTPSANLAPVGLTAAPEVNWTNSGAAAREALPPHPTDALPPSLQAPPFVRSATMAAPPTFEPKYSASMAGREKHVLYQSPAQVPTQTARPVQPSSLYPTSIDAPAPPPPPPPSIGDPVLIVDVPKQMPLGPQQVEVQNVTPTPAPPGAAMDTCACQPPTLSDATTTAIAQSTTVTEAPKIGLRDIHLSVEMLDSFLRVARSNTTREIETCAILAGELKPGMNVLEVNHLLVPRQKGTRDQVEMIDEELLLGEVLSKGLMVLGWIHTHPIFQCFLSSIDVHTTLPYQLLLEEAIAIVMAPTDRKRKCGVFRLTTPGGMDLIRDCQKRGFHQHPRTSTGQPIYEVSSHVYIDPKLHVTVTDMR